MFGKIENPKNERLLDLNHREFATFAPLLILAVWMGLYPSPFLRRLDTSVQHIIARVNPQYAQQNAANCGSVPVTAPAAAAVVAATTAAPSGTAGAAEPVATVAAAEPSAASFLAATPCDANGNPLASTEKR
jgi:NADH-quinone oxidoreductase subunit M